jgi:hypothetical protein
MCRPDVVAFHLPHGGEGSFADRLGLVADQLGFVAQVVQKPPADFDVEGTGEGHDDDCESNCSSATAVSPLSPSRPTAPPSPCKSNSSSKGFAESITDAALTARFHSLAGGNKWSFFSNATLCGQVVEHGEDPDVTARLARIKVRDNKPKSSWTTRLLAPLRP